MSAPLYVHAIAVWCPEYPDAAALSEGRRSASAVEPAAELLPRRMRGRASLLTAMLAEVVGRAAAAGGADLARVPLIVGSAFGEMDTTVQLLQMMISDDGALSPARFQASVHNTGAGQISIATSNTAVSSCLAAGSATSAAALLEAYALLAGAAGPCDDPAARSGGEVLVAVADEALPEFFADEERYGSLAVALLLRSRAEGALAALSLPAFLPAPPGGALHGGRLAEFASHPAAPLLGLACAALERSPATFALPMAAGRMQVELTLPERVARP